MDAQPVKRNLVERWDRLLELLEDRRRRRAIPGIVVGLVTRDGLREVHGLGVTDLDTGMEPGAETLFPLASVTKTLAAAWVTRRAVGGAFSLDDPVGRHWGDFRTRVGDALTIRDALSHRTGMANLDLLWYGGQASEEAILEAVARAEPLLPNGAGFLYNNVVFACGVRAAARAVGVDWLDGLRRDVLGPLGMLRTGRLGSGDGGAATGHRRDALGVVRRVPTRSLDVIEPAGGLETTGQDLLLWLAALLGDSEGEHLGDAVREALWTPHVALGPGAHYGLGWRLLEAGGRRVMEHSGGIDGFSCDLAVLPDEGVGWFLLTNLGGEAFAGQSHPVVLEALLGEGERRRAAVRRPDAAELQALAGDYEADFGPFPGVWFRVGVRPDGSGLELAVPGQATGDLIGPGENGDWRSELDWDTRLRFERDSGGAVSWMALEQAGMRFQLPRRGMERSLEHPPRPGDPEWAGTYASRMPQLRYRVYLRRGDLVVDVPDQMPYVLEAPDSRGWRAARVCPDKLAFRFRKRWGFGRRRMVLRQEGARVSFGKVGPDPCRDLPSVSEVMERVRSGAGRKIGDGDIWTLEGRVRHVHQGIEGRVRWVLHGLDGYVRRTDWGSFGWMEVEWRRGWGRVASAFDGTALLLGRDLASAAMEHPLRMLRDWTADFTGVEVCHRIEDGALDEPRVVVRVRSDDLPGRRIHVGERSGRWLLEERGEWMSETGGVMQRTEQFEDFRDVDGLRLPMRSAVRDAVTGVTEVEWESVSVGS